MGALLDHHKRDKTDSRSRTIMLLLLEAIMARQQRIKRLKNRLERGK